MIQSRQFTNLRWMVPGGSGWSVSQHISFLPARSCIAVNIPYIRGIALKRQVHKVDTIYVLHRYAYHLQRRVWVVTRQCCSPGSIECYTRDCPSFLRTRQHNWWEQLTGDVRDCQQETLPINKCTMASIACMSTTSSTQTRFGKRSSLRGTAVNARAIRLAASPRPLSVRTFANKNFAKEVSYSKCSLL